MPEPEKTQEFDLNTAKFKIGDKEGTIADIVSAMQYLSMQNTQLKQQLEKLQDGSSDTTPTTDKTTDKPSSTDSNKSPDVSDADIEEMTQAQLARHISAQIVKTINDELLSPMREQLASTSEAIDTHKVSQDIDKTSSSYEDFWTFGDEIKAVLDKHPDLSVDEAYHLAKSSSPEKVASLHKQAEEKKAAEAAEQNKKTQQEYGGLFPTSGKSVENSKLTSK